MRFAYRAEQVRLAEAPLLAADGAETVMRRAATGLAVACGRMLVDRCGRVTGSRVTLLVGSGNNGGDALWAGAWLADRGAKVTAIAMSPHLHDGGLQALLTAGGEIVEPSAGLSLIAAADLVIDGIVGIGGQGPLRGAAVEVARAAWASGAVVVACDLPSGVDADTGLIADPDAVVRADVTVTFGTLKPGVMVMPGAEMAGVVHCVDIGLGDYLTGDVVGEPALRVVGAADVALAMPAPGPHDHKYSRGVVVIDAGSSQYPGAGVLVTGSARYGGAGLVQHVGTELAAIESRFPDVVMGGPPSERATGLVIGSGLAGIHPDTSVLDVDYPVVLDATALRWMASSSEWAAAVHARGERGVITVLTPHEGELAPIAGSDDLNDHAEAARATARRWGAVVLVKGATTVVASPTGRTWVNPMAPADLATAGSGDVLSGLTGSLLAASEARAREEGRPLGPDRAAELAACAAWMHALAARLARGEAHRPVTAADLLETLPVAIGAVRTGRIDG